MLPITSRLGLPVCLSAVTSLLSFGAIAEEGDWNRWRGPNHNGIAATNKLSAEFPLAAPKQLWKAQIGTGFSSVAVSDGKVYAMGNTANKDTVTALNVADGKVVWSHSYDAPIDPNLYEGGPNSTPTVDGDKVYTMGRRGQVFCFDKATGKVIWSDNLAQKTGAQIPDWGLSGSPLVEGNVVIYNIGSAGTGVDKATGKILWRSGPGKAGYGSPVPFTMNGQRAVALFAAKALVALNPTTGQQFWSFPWETSYDVNAADPIVMGDSFFISSGYNRGCALITVKGNQPQKVWENKNMRTQFNPAVLIGGMLVGIDGNTSERATLKAIDPRTGQVRWVNQPVGNGGVIVVKDQLVVLGGNGQLLAGPVSGTGFQPKTRAQVLGGKTWTAPAFAHGKFYARNAKGDLVCMDMGAQ
ncbi:MAG: qgdA [Verrucomicrobia bacterium]|jgi:outer membrane protein assembly factor BamB|nr:qgdA [Verrucomicrobiota bacterium]